MNEKETNNGIAMAALKLSVIQPAFNGTFPDMSKKDYYVRIAAKPLKLPDGREVRYSPGTYACRESDYRKGGFDCEWHNKNTHFWRRKFPTLLCQI